MIDTVAPNSTAISGVLPTDSINDTGISSTDNITNNKAPTLTGTTEAGSTVIVTVNGVNYTATVTGTTWTVPLTGANLPDASYTPSIKATDAAGNSTTVAGETFTVDATAPSTPAIAPDMTAATDTGVSSTDNITANNKPDFAIPAPGAGNTPSLYIDGIKVPSTFNTSTNTLTPTNPIADGNHTITTTLTDVAGNESAQSPSLSAVIDTLAPSISAQTFSYPEHSVAGNPLGTVSASDSNSIGSYKFAATNTNTSADGFYQISNAGTISLTSAGVSSGANNFDIAPNSRTYSITAVDAAGNTAAANITLNETNVIDPPTATGSQVTGTEDTPYVFSWSNFGVTDMDTAVTSLGVKISSLPVNGLLQSSTNGTTWMNVNVNDLVSYNTINSGYLRFIPGTHESGVDAYGGTGVGNQQADYARFNFIPNDGSLDGASATMRVDITPVAEAPIVGGTFVSIGASFNGIGTGQDVAAPVGWLTNNTVNTSANVANPIEVNGSNLYGIQGIASNAMELERNAGDASNFYTEFNSVAGQNYVLTFDYSPRAGYIDGVNSAINVRYGLASLPTQTEAIVKTVNSTAIGWQRYSIVLVGTGSKMRLEFDAVDGSATTSVGGILDNIAFESANNVGAVGTVFNLSVPATLVDTDGSESITNLTVSSIPVGATISDGAHTFTSAAGTSSVNIATWNLSALTYNSNSAGNVTLNLSATSSESVGGSTATSTGTLNLLVLSQQTSAANGDLMVGTGVNDNIVGTAGNDQIYGGIGNDIINGGAGNDIINGGAGNDTMTGGTGADTFVFVRGDQGTVGSPALDKITDFDNTNNSDKLNLAGFLVGETHTGTGTAGAVGSTANYLHFELIGGNTIVDISTTGGFSGGYNAANNDERITLVGVDFVTNGAGTFTDTQIIASAIANGKLIRDENITGTTGNDTLLGGAGNTTINGGNGNDNILGGQGNDTLTGGAGVDTFRWVLSDNGTTTNPATDTITDFDKTAVTLDSLKQPNGGGDILDIRDLLVGESHSGTAAGNVPNFVHFELNAGNTIIHISTTGAYGTGGFAVGKDDQRITLTGVDLTSNSTLSDNAIIQSLLTANKLIID